MASSTLTAGAVDKAEAARNVWLALPVLMAGTFMIVLDFFIVNVALPSMQLDLHASVATIEWIVAGYGLTFATCLVTAGRIGDRIGRRRAFAIGLLLFMLASAVCGIAPDAKTLIAARLAQGVGGALLSPNVLAIIGVVYQGTDRVKAITVYGMVMGFAAAGAQLIGGLLMHADALGLGWRGVFLINVPVGFIALLLTARFVPESKANSRQGIDVLGTVLLTAGLTALLLPLVEGRQQGWPAWSWLSLTTAPIMLATFGLHQTRVSKQPLLDLAMFRQRALTTGLLTQLAFWCGQASFFLVLALYLQQGLGLDPLSSGETFTILAAAYLLTSLKAPSLTARYGRDLIAFGALTLALGHGCLMIGAIEQGSIAVLVPGLLLVGAGMGLCITPLVSTVLSHVDPQKAGAVSGVLSTMQQLGNALGVAVTGLLFFGTTYLGYAAAFELSLAQLAILLVAVAGLTRILPRTAR